MSLSNVFQHKVRGVRVIEIWGVAVLLVLILTVYLMKTGAGGESQKITGAERQIAQEQVRIRLLKAEVAYLEQPGRMQRLSEQYLGLEPISGKKEAAPENLPELTHPEAPPK